MSFTRGQILSAADLNAALIESANTALEGSGFYVAQMTAGDVWLTVNAKWDKELGRWNRIDTSAYAYAFVFQAFSSIPGEEAFGGNTAIMMLRAVPAPNPLGPFWAVGGWENLAIFDQFRHIVTGGEGIEVDGSGTFPYGRFVHAPASGVVRTGTLTNLFVDFSGVDSNTAPSWFIGRKDDAFVAERAPAGATTNAGLVGLLLLDAFGDLAIAGNLTVQGAQVICSSLVDAANDGAAAAAGVPLHGFYHNAGAVRYRIV